MKYLLIFLLSFCTLVRAQNVPVLNVAVHVGEPHVIKTHGEFSGFDIDLWRAVAKEAEIGWVFDDGQIPEILTGLEQRHIDVGLGAISMTSERETRLDYSHAYMESGLKILVKGERKETGLWASIKEGRYVKILFATVVKPAVLEVGFWLLVFILIVSHIIYFADLGKDTTAISDNYFKGIFEAFYYCIVTCSTVGFGDVTMKRWFSRLITCVLILCGIAFFGNFVATLSAQLVTDQVINSPIRSMDDLKGKRVGVEAGTTCERSAAKYTKKTERFASFDYALEALKAGKVEAVVADAPLVDYAAKKNPDLIAVDKLFEPQDYGFVLQNNSPFRERINLALLRVMESGEYQKIHNNWFGAK